MEANQGQNVSVERFKINHLRQRIAEQAVKHEDELASAAIRLQLQVQETEMWKKRATDALEQLGETNVDVESTDQDESHDPT